MTCFLLWKGEIDKLHQFIEHLNQNDQNIRLTYSFDHKQICFLDLLISIEDGSLVTQTFRKETAAHTLLQADSHHPEWLKNGILVGKLLRMKPDCKKK